MTDWFTVDRLDDDTCAISEYRHPEETHCYLICGSERALLIDTGLGVGNISEVVRELTGLPVAAAATHIHWDHIGGHRYFDFCVHSAELDWISGDFPLSADIVRKNLAAGDCLPEGFDLGKYETFKGAPSAVLSDGGVIELGGRSLRVLHTPGHSPGHMCFFEEQRGYLFTGDLVYKGTLFAFYPSTDPAAYLNSLKKIERLPVKRLFPAHHSLDIEPEIITRMRVAFEELDDKGLLRHGGGKFDFGDWSLWI